MGHTDLHTWVVSPVAIVFDTRIPLFADSGHAQNP